MLSVCNFDVFIKVTVILPEAGFSKRKKKKKKKKGMTKGKKKDLNMQIFKVNKDHNLDNVNWKHFSNISLIQRGS